jgi:hypothetical protein
VSEDGYKHGSAYYHRVRRIRQQLEAGWEPNYTQSDPQVVPTEELASVLRRVADEWDAYHIDEYSHRAQYSFTSVVAELAGIDDRIVRRILMSQFRCTNLSIADKILTALDMSYVLGNEIHVIPNPTWSQERWQAWMSYRGCGAEE